MACRLPHSVKQMQDFIQKQCDKEDVDRQKAFIDIINLFRLAKAKKERMGQRYTKWTDIFEERKAVIDKFFNEEAHKDLAIEYTLWGCVSQIQSNISNKIQWSFQKNKVVGSVSQQVPP